jgi:peptidoglycan/LPS O-acetylase OafA/YrhL
MDGDPRHSLAGTLLPIGGVIVVVCVVSAADADVRPGARVLWLLPAVAVIVVAMVWLWRDLRSRGRRAAGRATQERESGG